MKALLIAVVLTLTTLTAFAAEKDEKREPSEPQKAQQSNPQEARTAACNKEASDKNLKGDQRKTFMSSCVKGGSKTAQ